MPPHIMAVYRANLLRPRQLQCLLWGGYVKKTKEDGAMKKAISLIAAVVLCVALFAACDGSSVGIIGGADGPTEVYVAVGAAGQPPAE